jgi:hypothetical protein
MRILSDIHDGCDPGSQAFCLAFSDLSSGSGGVNGVKI